MDRDTVTQPWRPVIVVLAAVLFLWPALVNGGPFFTTDTIGYIRNPDQAIIKVLGPQAGTAWSAKPMGQPFAVAPATPGKPAVKAPPMAGRSIYYGALVNLGARTGGFWLTLAVQALAASFAVDMACRALGWRRRRTFVAAVAAAALLTPLAFNVSCLMPDVWAAILVLVAGAVVAGGDRLTRTDLVLALVMMTYAGAVHTSLLPILFVLAGCAALLVFARRWMKSGSGAPLTLAILATMSLIGAVAAGAVFNIAVTKVYGEPALSPPFLTARLVGDGHVGEAWLKTHCPQSGFVTCKVANRLPISTDDFLWSADPAHAAFFTASLEDRRAMAHEQSALVAAVVRDRPLAAARDFVADGASQLATLSLEDFNHKPSVRQSIDAWMVGPDATSWRASMAYRQAWPIQPMNLVLAWLVIASVVLIAVLAVQTVFNCPAAEDDDRRRLLMAAFVIVAAITANAAICGGLSGVFGRYQSRIVAPLILAGLGAAVIATRQREQPVWVAYRGPNFQPVGVSG